MAVWDNLFIALEDAVEPLADTKADLEFVLHTETLFLAWDLPPCLIGFPQTTPVAHQGSGLWLRP